MMTMPQQHSSLGASDGAVSNDNGVAGRADGDEEKIEELSCRRLTDHCEESHQEANEQQHKEEEELTWLDSQSSINDLTKEINNNNNSASDSRAPRRRRLRLKIIQTFREEELTLDRLLASLGGSGGSSDLKSLTLLGVSVDGTLADKLAPVLKKQRGLTNFSLHKLLPSGILPLCAALKGHPVLRELRLHLSPATDDEDPATSVLVCTLFETLASLPKLGVLKLSGFAFNAQSTRSAAILLSQASSTIADLRITSCTNVNLAALAKAIQHANSVRYLDFSMNGLCDHRALSVLLQIPSIQDLILSDNEFGGQGYDNDVENALRSNTTLQRLEMDMNPLSEPFCRGLERALENDNVTLEYIWLLSRSSDASAAAAELIRRLDYYCDLNAAGYRLWRGRRNNAAPYYETLPKLLPFVLNQQATPTPAPAMLFGLLREDAGLLAVSRLSDTKH